MIDGFWILKILPLPVSTGGVAVFINGKVFGGDSGFTWVGSYTVRDQLIKARVNVHHFDPDTQSILGLEGDYDMHLSGTLHGDTITGTAMVANQPQHTVAIRLEKRAEL
jgi:hypothetical protein